MKIILNISESYTGFPQDFKEMAVTLMALRQYDRRGRGNDNYTKMEDIKGEPWFEHWHKRTTDHFFENGKAVGITKNRYYAFVVQLVDLSDFVSLTSDKEFDIKLYKTNCVEVEYELKLT